MAANHLLAASRSERQRAPVQLATPSAATADDPAIQAAVKQSLNAFQSGDYAGAARYADSVLLQIPNHPEARRIAARAREAADTIDRGLRDARTLFDAGRYDDAAEAAGSVLSVSPSNADAKRIMAESSARSRGRAVDDARARMVQAKSAAVAAAAAKLAASSYGVALAAEREAARLQKAGRVSDAAAKFYEAGGLFRSAEIAAQTAAAVTSQRMAAATPPPPAQVAGPPPPAGPATNPTLPSLPVTPVERPTAPWHRHRRPRLRPRHGPRRRPLRRQHSRSQIPRPRMRRPSPPSVTCWDDTSWHSRAEAWRR